MEQQDDDLVVIDELDTAGGDTEHDDDQHDAQGAGETPDGEGADTEAGAADGEADEVEVSIGDEQPESDDEAQHAAAPAWVKDLRKQNRALVREKRELEARLAAKSAPADAPGTVVVGAKPTLEACDFDAERFERELEAWHSRKLQADELQRKQEAAEQGARAEWQKKLDAYGAAKAAMKVRDFEDAEDIARDSLSVVQQGLILNGAENPALLVYALGKNPKKARELAAITDPVKFAFAAAKLETQLKVQPRKTAPAPERAVRGTAPVTGAADNTLDRLRAEADKTGDRSKVAAYLRSKRAGK